MDAGWPDIEKIVAKKVREALSTKILLLFLFALLLLPQGAEAQQIKTVSYMLDQYLDADITQSDIASATAWNTQTINIPFPEDGVIVRNAWIEFHAISTTTVATITQNVSIRFRTNTANGEYSVIALDPLKKYLSGTTEEFNFWVFADVTSAFATITNPMVVNASIIVTGPPTNQHAATLHITYEYDETSATQVNTVAFPLATVAGQVAAAATAVIPYNITIPEMDSVVNAWAEIHAVEVSAGTTDGKLQAAVGSDALSKYYYVEVGSRASYDAVFLFNLNSSNFKANASVLKITATTIPFVTLGGTIYVTYNYSSLHPMRTKTISYFAGQNTTKGVTDKSQFTAATAFMPEPNATAVAAWAHVLAGWTSATAGTATISGMIGSTPVATTAYTLDIDTLNMNEHHIFHNMSVANLGGVLVNNTAINVSAAYSATTSNGFGAEFLMTYIHNVNSSALVQQKTVKYFATQTTREVGANNQNPNITKVQTFIPEARTLKRSANLYAIFMSNISTGVTAYEILTNISINGNSANKSVTKSATAVRNTASIFNGDEDNIINATAYNWTFWFAQQSPQPSTARTGAAFSARFYLTYEYNVSTFPPRWSSPATNNSPLQNYNINFSVRWNDDYGLSSYIFSINQSGNWVNSTLTPFSNGGLASNVTQITLPPGRVIEWRFYANDSDNMWNVTAIQTLTIVPSLRYNTTFGNNISGITRSSIAVGDINDDGLYDFVLMGMNMSSKLPITEVYINKGTDLIQNTSWSVNMTKLGNGALALTDFDNDGRLDLIQTGQNDSAGNPGRQIYVYTNNGSAFVQNKSWFMNLSAVTNGSIGVGDIDSDGKIDAVVSGTAKIQVGAVAKNQGLTQTYINNGTGLAFNRSYNVNLSNLNSSSILLADFDNDTKLDLLLAGKSGVTNFTNLYTNNGTSFTYNLTYGANLSKSSTTNLAFADIDNNGRLDVVQLIAQGVAMARVYLNNGTALEENRTWALNLTATNFGGATLGDINNDGWVDMVTQGLTPTPSADTQVFISNRTSFQNNVPYESELINSSLGDVALADFTNDSALDLITSGQSNQAGGLNFTRIYTNDIHLNNTNVKPSPPTSFSSLVTPTSITFNWNSGSDTETPASGLYYHLRVGTCSGCNDIMSGAYGGSGPAADGLFGNMQKRQQVTLYLDTSTAYYWSVFAIDAGRSRSAASAEQTANAFTDTIAPTASNIKLNQSAGIKQNDWVNFSADWTDNYKLYAYWLSLNQSNDPNVNSSPTEFPAQITTGAASNITRITANPGRSVSWQPYANDTTNNIGGAGWQNFTIEPAFRYNTTFGNNISGITRSSFAIGDINNDSLLDFVIAGMNMSSKLPITEVYINKGTDLIQNTSWSVNMTKLGNGALALTDFDNDGRLDLIQTGQNDSAGNPGRQIYVYINDGGKFVQNKTWFYNLSPIINGSIAVGDIDNNGTLDVVVSGTAKIQVGAVAKNQGLTQTYLNNGSTLYFSRDYTVNVSNLNDSAALLVDFNNDSLLDLALAGTTVGPANKITNITATYLNNGTGFSQSFSFGKNIINTFPAVLGSADIDNDGAMDLLQFSAARRSNAVIYLNNNNSNNFVENLSWSVNITKMTSVENALGDVNNDGWLDLVSFGVSNLVSGQVYLSNRSSFVDSVAYASEFIDSAFGDAALADFTNDSDLDLIITGQTNLAGGLNNSRIYVNDIHLNNTNTLPSPPTTFSSASGGSGNITLYWNAGSDTETPKSGLYYNLRMGACSGCQNIISGVYGGAGPDGVLRLGNMQKRQRLFLRISNASTYYWAVQAIDTGLAASAWSAEQTYPPADTTRPTWDSQYQSANSISQLGSVDLSAYGQDETNLTYATLVTNETGAWKNITDGQYGSPLKLGGNTSRQAINFTWTNYTLEGGQNIGWYIMLNDSAGNTNTTFMRNFTLLKTISIKINNTAMNFSELTPGLSNESRPVPGWNPLPFLLYNDGNFAVNITIDAADLFQKAVNPSRFFMFNSSLNTTGTVRDETKELVQAYTNMPATGNAVMVANMTNFTANKNQINVNINITVPTNEPPTGKLATITFTASQAY